ncbi:MAG TPA: glycosyltransferase family 4 protein [Chitinophagaceae bacterium]
MNILLNLIPVVQGGGLQVAANFIDIISENNYNHSWYILVNKRGELSNLLKKRNKLTYFEVSNSVLPRLYFEKFQVPKLIRKFKIDIIYSFGPGIINNNIPTVVRSAYSNIYYPEINFWRNWPWRKRVIAELKDKYRLTKTIKADSIIFENAGMRHRAIKNFGYSEMNTFFIKPSVSKFNDIDFFDTNETPENIKVIPSEAFNIIMLTSWHKNKNIDIVPYVLKNLKNRGIRNVNFIITVASSHVYSNNLVQQAKKFKVEQNLFLVGRIKVNEIRHLYAKSTASILLSKLECFSSNIIEAWAYKKPLIISNEEWSKSICGEDSVIYVNRDDPDEVAEKIKILIQNPDYYKKIVKAGYDKLQTYNTPEEKVFKQVKILEFIHLNFLQNGKEWYTNKTITNQLCDD